MCTLCGLCSLGQSSRTARMPPPNTQLSSSSLLSTHHKCVIPCRRCRIATSENLLARLPHSRSVFLCFHSQWYSSTLYTMSADTAIFHAPQKASGRKCSSNTLLFSVHQSTNKTPRARVEKCITFLVPVMRYLLAAPE